MKVPVRPMPALQCTSTGPAPAMLSCLAFTSCRKFSTQPGSVGTPWSGQAWKWKWNTFRCSPDSDFSAERATMNLRKSSKTHSDVAEVRLLSLLWPVARTLALAALQNLGGHHDDPRVLLPHRVPELVRRAGKTALRGDVQLLAHLSRRTLHRPHIVGVDVVPIHPSQHDARFLDTTIDTTGVDSGSVERLFQMDHNTTGLHHWIVTVMFYQFSQTVETFTTSDIKASLDVANHDVYSEILAPENFHSFLSPGSSVRPPVLTNVRGTNVRWWGQRSSKDISVLHQLG
ncbi:hypothetical protein B566_EDAN002624 [Ephemera danica]|nr:hypothetical protein B566_EDAN002624 [Ephemera danica]